MIVMRLFRDDFDELSDMTILIISSSIFNGYHCCNQKELILPRWNQKVLDHFNMDLILVVLLTRY